MSQLPTRSEIERLVAETRCLNCGSPLPKVVIPLYQNPGKMLKLEAAPKEALEIMEMLNSLIPTLQRNAMTGIDWLNLQGWANTLSHIAKAGYGERQ